MKTRLPEDLSALPDAGTDPTPPAAAESSLPEDLSGLPEAPARPQAEPHAAGAKAARRRGRPVTLLVAALAALALLAIAVEVDRMLVASFGVHPALGWAMAGLLALATALVALIVAREVEGYVRLSSFEELKETYEALRDDPTSHELHGRAQREVERFLRCLEETAEPELLLKTRRLRDRMDLADTPPEWADDIERVLLSDMDEQARAAISREAVNVGIGTAVSPYGVLDALIVIWRNVRLIRGIAAIYRVRAGAYGTWVILRRTVAAAAMADLAQEVSVALLGTTRSLASLIGAPIAQGMANAAMTVRVGLKALEECRPLSLPEEKRVGAVKTLMGSVTSAVRRLSPPPAPEEEPAV
jgi:putative membrane protein